MQQAARSATTLAIPEEEADARPGMGPGAALLATLHWSLPPPKASDRGRRLVWVTALGISLMAHAAVLYAMIRQPNESLAGGGGQVIDAISVTIVSSNVLESREPERTQQTLAAASASVESTDGVAESAAAAPAEQREEREGKPEEKKEKPKDEPVREADAVLELPQEPQQQKKQERAAPAAGGAAARSDVASDAKTSAPATASPGVAREYSRYVAQALAKTKPKGTGGLGTVRVKFVIAGDGGLAMIEIDKSSGSPKLDDVVLGAVRRTKFLTPPAGMTPVQLTYVVPYHFR